MYAHGQNCKCFYFPILTTISLFSASGNNNTIFPPALPTFIKEERDNYYCYLLSPVYSFNFYTRFPRKFMYLFQAFDGIVNMYQNNFLQGNHSKCIAEFLLLGGRRKKTSYMLETQVRSSHSKQPIDMLPPNSQSKCQRGKKNQRNLQCIFK